MGEVNGPVISNRAKAVMFILAALLLTGFGIEESLNEHERAAVLNAIPNVSDMATSPTVQELIDDSRQTANEPAITENTPDGGAEAPAAAGGGLAAEPLTAISTGALDGYENVIYIEKIGAELPIIDSDSYDNRVLHNELDDGAVRYPASALFGQEGQTVLLGHSAPDNWPDIKHDTAFSRIDELGAGDEIAVYFRDKIYTYSVTRSEIIAKGGDLSGEPPSGNSLVLVSCWPPGRDLNRIAVEAILTGVK